MRWYFQVLRKYAVFAGRSRRKEWWTFGLIYLVTVFACKGIDILIRTYDHDSRYGLVSGFYVLATFIPVIAVTVRRLHDTNRSGWWYFIIFIPLAGIMVLLRFMVEDSQPGENQYGPNPKMYQAGATAVQSELF